MNNNRKFKVGAWLVEPSLDRISSEESENTLRPQVMELLVYLADRAGEVISQDELLEQLWGCLLYTSPSPRDA